MGIATQPELIAPPPTCRHCKVVSDPAKVEPSGIRDAKGVEVVRCIDTDACRKLDEERFAKVFGDSPTIMAARARGIAAANEFLGRGAA
jgi:hypothetical protein